MEGERIEAAELPADFCHFCFFLQEITYYLVNSKELSF
jgi:hypothetical protein